MLIVIYLYTYYFPRQGCPPVIPTYVHRVWTLKSWGFVYGIDIYDANFYFCHETRLRLPSFRDPYESAGFRVFGGQRLLYIAYVDEFGHIGPYVSREDKRYNDSPVFGLGGFILPADEVRAFSTFFFQLKCKLLEWEIKQSGTAPAVWEKKGSSLYTTQNVTKYRELRVATNRLLNKIHNVGGAVFYNGIQKTREPEKANAQGLYLSALSRMLTTVNAFAASKKAKIMIVMDEHQDRDAILTAASQAMFRPHFQKRHIIEPPFQVESHRYQTCQCADWLCGLYGRLGSFRAKPDEYSDMDWAEKYFATRIENVAWQSSLKLVDTVLPRTDLPEAEAVELAVEEDSAKEVQPSSD